MFLKDLIFFQSFVLSKIFTGKQFGRDIAKLPSRIILPLADFSICVNTAFHNVKNVPF